MISRQEQLRLGGQIDNTKFAINRFPAKGFPTDE